MIYLTAAELIIDRVDCTKPNMGLTNWQSAKVRKQDISIAKNYLDAEEVSSADLGFCRLPSVGIRCRYVIAKLLGGCGIVITDEKGVPVFVAVAQLPLLDTLFFCFGELDLLWLFTCY